jgi:hypothetical protein
MHFIELVLYFTRSSECQNQFHFNSQTFWTFSALYIEIVYTMFQGQIRPSSSGLLLPKQNGDK